MKVEKSKRNWFASFSRFQQRQDGGRVEAAIGQAGGRRLAKQYGIRKILHFRQVGVRAFHNNRGGFAFPGQVEVFPGSSIKRLRDVQGASSPTISMNTCSGILKLQSNWK